MSAYTPGRSARSLAYDPAFDYTAGRGQAQATYVFGLVDAATNRILGSLNPVRDQAPTLTHDTTQTVKRKLTVVLNPDDAAVFDPIAHRVTVAMVTGDGRVWPLGGRYMAADDTVTTGTEGDHASVALVDELAVVNTAMDTGFAAQSAAGTPVVAFGRNAGVVIAGFLSRYPLFAQEPTAFAPSTTVPTRGYRVPLAIDATVFLSTGSWAAGTSGSQVLTDLATTGDYMPPWIDNTGAVRMIRTLDPASTVPAFDFDAGGTVLRGSITTTSDTLAAPNRFVVVSSTGTGDVRKQPITGTYDIPAAAPWSIAARGYVVPQVTSMQVSTIPQALAAARALALRTHVGETVTLSTLPDPRHDGYDIVRWQGAQWLETAWSLPLTPGGAMQHTLRRIYT